MSTPVEPLASRSHPDFRALLTAEYLLGLEEHAHTVYGVWPDLTLAYMNPAWFGFARSNGGEHIGREWTIGRSTLEAIPEQIQPWYRQFLAAALDAEGLHPSRHDYECSSADLYREFMMMVYPVGTGDQRALVVVNSLRIESGQEDRERVPMPPLTKRYSDSRGLIHQCMHCRRVRSAVPPCSWDWVPDWIRHPQAGTSHGLCEVCLGHYYRPV